MKFARFTLDCKTSYFLRVSYACNLFLKKMVCIFTKNVIFSNKPNASLTSDL